MLMLAASNFCCQHTGALPLDHFQHRVNAHERTGGTWLLLNACAPSSCPLPGHMDDLLLFICNKNVNVVGLFQSLNLQMCLLALQSLLWYGIW